MTIAVYSKEGCGICSAAKDKLNRMGLTYSTHDLPQTIEPHQGWREDGSVDVLAAYALIGNKLPVIRIDEEFHDYPGAMKRLKGLGLMERANQGSETTH
jgi:glutaredoxin